ncbi:MAG: TolC family protein [Acidobacteriia bacterium]|nr:TolC family protein [Terriglobia bacterium]
MAFRTLVAGLLLAVSAFAQMRVFPKPSYFRETFKRPIQKVELQAPVRLSDFQVDAADANGKPLLDANGRPVKKVELSLKNYLALVMSNHTDVQVQLLTLETSQNSITSAKAIWDPKSVTVGFNPNWRTTSPWPNDPSGSVSKSQTWPISLSFNQQLPTGQSINVSGSGSKSSSWGDYPSFGTSMSFGVTQPLMKGRASYVVRYSLMSAQNSYKVTEFNLKDRIITTISSAESLYWAAINARETLRVREKALATANANWDYVQRQFNLGAVSYLDTYSPQQNVASAKVSLSQAQFNLRDAYDRLRRQIGADLDPAFRNMEISLTESVEVTPTEIITPDREQTVQKALATLPSLMSTRQTLEFQDVTIAQRRDAMLPQFDLNLNYRGGGNGGYFADRFGTSVYPGGLGDALGQMFGWGSPSYTAGLTLTLPIRNRQTSMDLANALITKKTQMLNLRSAEQNARQSVGLALSSFENAKASLELQKTALDFAQKDYDGKKLQYELGSINLNFLVQQEQSLAQAELSYVQAQVNVKTAYLNLLQTTGELLDARGIVIR